jgi:serine/threonine protein kinase
MLCLPHHKQAFTAMTRFTPTKLGRYEIVDEIGKGAMGVAYLARDPLIGRLVALKTFRIGDSVKDQEMERLRLFFLREAQAAGILSHPNIVTILDVVEESEEGLAFIAMEYVRGTSLKLMLQGDQPLTLPFVLEIVSQVGDALDYAHSNRVIHRNVKPANILITTENRVKITDFGIAVIDGSNLTQDGQILGTPNYMSPEQIQGKGVDYRTDLFSLGVVLYEMLTRHKPFQGENLTVVSHRIVYDHFTPLQEYIQDLPPGIDRILAKALDKEPTRRYQRAREMTADLWRSLKSIMSGNEFDVFICHASEDKADFVEALAQRLKERELRVWYDSFRLKVGDSLRAAIDEGLARSRFGIVILSQSFCRKDWPKRELEGLLALERGGRKIILPLWHGVTHEDVSRFSPILADRVALTSKLPLERIVDEILSVVRD